MDDEQISNSTLRDSLRERNPRRSLSGFSKIRRLGYGSTRYLPSGFSHGILIYENEGASPPWLPANGNVRLSQFHTHKKTNRIVPFPASNSRRLYRMFSKIC